MGWAVVSPDHNLYRDAASRFGVCNLRELVPKKYRNDYCRMAFEFRKTYSALFQILDVLLIERQMTAKMKQLQTAFRAFDYSKAVIVTPRTVKLFFGTSTGSYISNKRANMDFVQEVILPKKWEQIMSFPRKHQTDVCDALMMGWYYSLSRKMCRVTPLFRLAITKRCGKALTQPMLGKKVRRDELVLNFVPGDDHADLQSSMASPRLKATFKLWTSEEREFVMNEIPEALAKVVNGPSEAKAATLRLTLEDGEDSNNDGSCDDEKEDAAEERVAEVIVDAISSAAVGTKRKRTAMIPFTAPGEAAVQTVPLPLPPAATQSLSAVLGMCV